MSFLTLELMARNNNKPTKWELKGKKPKPCPFCGSTEIHLAEFEKDDDCKDELHWVGCSSCGVEGPVRSDRVHAVAAWQNRYNQEAQ